MASPISSPGQYSEADLQEASRSEFNEAAREREFADLASQLDDATRGSNQYLRESTAKKWFAEALKEEDPRQYFKQNILPRMTYWKQIRTDFDDVSKKLDGCITPDDFDVLQPEAFWKLDPEERERYIDKARDVIRKSKTFKERYAKIADQVRAYTRVTFDELHSASAKETRELLDGLKFIKTENDLEGWEDYTNGLMKQQLASARRLYYEQLMDPLLGLLKDKVISTRVVKEMQEKFWDSNVGYKAKESYILKMLPTRIEKWKKVKEDRDALIKKNPTLKQMLKGKVKDLDNFMDETAFLNMKYPKRKSVTDEIAAVLSAQENGMEYLLNDVRASLMSFAQDGRMHPSTVGTWMKRIFTKNATVDGVKEYWLTTVEPNAARWLKARQNFDKLNGEITEKGVPRGLHRLTHNQFLLLEYDQRIAYLEEVESRLDSDPNADGKLASLTLRVRHGFDTDDWEGAGEALKQARAIAPNDKAVKSMTNYLRTHRPKVSEEKKEDPDPQKILEELRDIVGHVPGMLRKIYLEAMKRGPEEFAAVLTTAYNLVWVHEHRYSNPLMDQKNAESEHHKAQTENYINNGHSRKLEHNILEGDTAHRGAIRDDCTKAQVAHVGDEAGCAVFVDKCAQNKDNEKFRYWTTLHTKDITYEQHRMVVRNFNYKLKTGMRTLAKMGYTFTEAGSLERKNGSTVPSAKQETAKKTHAPAFTTAA